MNVHYPPEAPSFYRGHKVLTLGLYFYIKGGLQMINIENYIMSQKLVWMKHFTSEAPWVKL